jgi:nicotinate-nucleotide adenylyltransferase
LGGTFDPVHIGHLVAAADARAALALDRVLLMVANAPWQKVGEREVTPAADRLAMVAAAVEGVDGLEACDLEIRRGGETYTADTLAALQQELTDTQLYLIVGTDVARELHTWKRTEEVRRLCTLAVVDRAGEVADVEALRESGWRAERVTIPAIELSSTDIRNRLAAGRPIDYLVPAAAIRCLRDRGLYADSR